MTLGTAIIISLLAVVALVAEIILYFFFGIGAAIAGGAQAMSGIAQFFVGLMVVTGALGILAPVCAVVELLTKKTNLGYYLLLPSIGLIAVGYLALAIATPRVIMPAASQASHAPSSAPPSRGSEPEAGSVAQVPPERAYLGRVVAQDITVGVSVLDEPGVFGEVKNIGDRPLDEVEITIFFLDKSGRRIHEKTYRPVFVSEFSFGDSNSPLKPGYSRKFGVKASDAPSEWAKKVVVEVTSVGFSK